MAEEQKLVKVKLSRPYTTNGYILGYSERVNGEDKPYKMRYDEKRRKGAPELVFTGDALVTPEEKEDLERREAEYQEYEAQLNRDGGGQIPVAL